LKKIVNISGIDPLALLGTNDQNLKLLENQSSAKIVVRGNDMIIDGNESDIDLIELVIKDMIITINQKGFVDKDDVKTLLNLSENETTRVTNNDKNHIVLYTHKGAVYARTPGQQRYLDAVLNNDITFGIGPAGTGKTYQAVASAVSSLKNREVSKIVITRPAVEAGERLGFLPGDLKDKVDPYLTPIYDALSQMIQPEKLKGYLEQRVIEVAPLAYMRGRTLHNSFMILDEAQNATRMQMKMFLTRLGVTSKAIITGDITQIDLPTNNISGLIDASNILEGVDGIAFVYFHEEDVVRHKLVKNIIRAYSNNNEKG
jgi:phosphate starvation-inducible protein PhoH and related proteins